MSGEGTSVDIIGVTETVAGKKASEGSAMPGANMAILGMNLCVQV